MAIFRRRFAELVDRQLAIFVEDHAGELAAIAAARERYTRSEEGDSTTAYGDYQDLVDWAADDVVALRDGYAATLDDDAAAGYRSAFNRGLRRRLPLLADALADALAVEDDE
jgi:hypothetical protein